MNIKFDFQIIGLNYYRSLLTSQGFEPKINFQVIFVAVCY